MSLVDDCAGVVCDLDGVVYRGPVAIEHAVDALNASPVPVHYATNNASRPPEQVAEHLRELGLSKVQASHVTGSSQAGAWVLAERIGSASVLPVGGPGVSAALLEQGLQVWEAASGAWPAAVLQGYGADVTAADLAEAAYAIQAGALWCATNTDATLPTDRGIAPGNGSLVAAVRMAVGREPDLVAGKPHEPLYRLCAERMGLDAEQVLAVGDRLETDIEGAHRTGMRSVLVLTGVHGIDDVLAAPPLQRPSTVIPDLRWLTVDLAPSLVEGNERLRRLCRARDEGTADLSAAEIEIETGRIKDMLQPDTAGSVGAPAPERATTTEE